MYHRVGRSALGPEWCSSLLRTIRSRSFEICTFPILGALRCRERSTGRVRSVRAQVIFLKKELLSEIIYVILDNRLRIGMDGLMHL
jgi:hypothetical protein